MTTVITRYFDSRDKALLFRKELLIRQSVPSDVVAFFDKADGLADALVAGRVDADTAQAYQTRVATGGAVVMVRAGYTPLGVARITRQAAEANGATMLDGMVEEVFVREAASKGRSIIPGSPLMMTKRLDIPKTDYHMANWPIPLISRRQPGDLSLSVFPVHGRMAEWALPLISRAKPFRGSIIDDHARMANWPIGLLVPGHKFMANFPFGHIVPGHKYMAKFPFAHIVPGHKFMANFPFGHIVPGRGSMANWPFPHLINGKPGTNSLIPGGPRMANFPISLLSSRKPFTGSIFDRHTRMANFPFGLISKRKPITASAFPRHARMANFILPLVIKDRAPRKSQGFSISRLFGLPTLVRR